MLLLIVIYISFISLGLPDSLFGVSWPVVHMEFGTAESFASIYTVIIGVCTGGVSFIAGKVIRKFGTGRVTFFSTLLTAVGLFGISFSPNIVVMMICSIILGYGAGAIDTGLNSYVSLHYKAKHMNWLHCFWGMGVAISPMIMSAFLGEGEGAWRTGYRVVAMLQLLIALFVLTSLKKWNQDAVAQTQQEERSEATMGQLFRAKGLVTSILSLGLYCSAEYVIGTWGATYAVNVHSIAPEIAARWVSLYYGGIMVGRMICGFLPDAVTDNQRIRYGVALSVLGMVILLLPFKSVSLAGLLLIGIGFGPIFPAVIHSVPARFGATYSADLTGYHMGGAFGIGYAVQMIFGYLAVATGYSIMPAVLILLLGGVFLCNAMTLRKVGQTK